MRVSTVLRPAVLGLASVHSLVHVKSATAEALEVVQPSDQPAPPLAFDPEHQVAAAVNKTSVHPAVSNREDDDQPSWHPPSISPQRRQANKIRQPPPASADDFAKAVAKGCNLLYMIRASPSDALTRMQQNPALKSLHDSQSPWTNAGALATYGWTVIKNNVNWAYMGIKEVTDELKIDTTDSKANLNVQLLQNKAVTVEGKAYAISGGTYDQAINVAAGLVIPYYIYSPAHEAKGAGPIVPLAQYSDVLFLEYSKLAGRAKPEADMKGLNWMLFLNVENVDTWALVLTALKNRKMDYWPGTEFTMDTDEGKALLASQVGAPLGWMLVQHKDAFGRRTVVKVRVFRNKGMTNQDTDQPYPSLLFYLGDGVETANESVRCEAEDVSCCVESK